MKTRELENLGFKEREIVVLARDAADRASAFGMSKSSLRGELERLVKDPDAYLEHEHFSELASRMKENRTSMGGNSAFSSISYASWGDDIDAAAHKQMENACSLPVARRAALMPDAHVGYGLPIGGVLATEDAVIPYAVGVDIACRVMLTVLEMPIESLRRNTQKLEQALEQNTSFGIGAKFREKRRHEVMDEDWNVTPLTGRLKDLAWNQLGTSGSGNHFVEYGEFDLLEETEGLAPGKYLALVSHSGSRGPGSQVASHYSDLARRLHPRLPKELSHLAWLPMSQEGAEYWKAMELMGRYASANHHVIHNSILKALGVKKLLQVENHHNYAWKEVHDGKELIVHRKGATPAGAGVLGYIPGSMTAPGYLVMGKGNEASLNSASHGAGRAMSRKEAKSTTTKHALQKVVKDAGVRLLSAGLDESPHAYKNIEAVMRAQNSLVQIKGRFQPKIVKMAPEGEKPED